MTEETKENLEKVVEEVKEPVNTGELQVERNEDGTFKEGVSGNPAGKPKGSRDFKTIFEDALKKIAEEKNINPNSVEVDLVIRAISEARKGNFKYHKDLFDRNYGKPQQKIDVTTKGESINEESREKASKAINGAMPTDIGGGE